MKCICGYEQGNDWVIPEGKEIEEYVEVNPKGEKFIEINGNFTINSVMRYAYNIKEVRLYACPECGTAKMVEN